MSDIDKIIIITKKTALEELVERFNTREQARFYLEHMGASFVEYQAAHDAYVAALATLKRDLPQDIRCQFVERGFLPTFCFGKSDLVVTLGPDGLVANTAKYLSGQSLLALNPDPARIDGILVPFPIDMAATMLQAVLHERYTLKHISMARATLNDGQSLYAVNDLFIGQRTHMSARYRLAIGRKAEHQSSSGIIVSTGAGSTGWFRSIITGAAELMADYTAADNLRVVAQRYRFDWEADYLYFSVREPFISRISTASLVFGRITGEEYLEITSQMPQNGVIFSDGIEADHLPFNSGTIARIGLADKKVHLIVGT